MKHMICAGVLAALLAGSLPAETAPSTAATPAHAFVIRGVRVFDGVKLLGPLDVSVRGGKIAAVGKGLQVPSGTEEIAGAGKTLLPGLIDSHTHVWATALHQALLFGVTTELDMFMATDTAKQIKAEQAAGRGLDQADLRSAGTLATAPGGHGTEYGLPIPTLSKPEEAAAWVDARIAEGSDYIKVVIEDGKEIGWSVPTLDAPTVAAIVTAAHKRGRMVVVHIETLAAAREAIDAGADGLAHLFIDQQPDAEFGRYAAAHHVFVIPTLSVFHGHTGAPAGDALVDDPRLTPYIDPDQAASLARTFPKLPGSVASYTPLPAAVKQLLAAGVPILAGTDSPNPGTAHGISMHGEMALLVEAGLTPSQALAAATSVPAKIFHLDDRGRIAPGLRADLVLVDGDPTTDIRQTRAIAAVWKLGVPADRAALRAEVAKTHATQTTFGKSWSISTDSLVGGTSTASIQAVDEVPPQAPNPPLLEGPGFARTMEVRGTLVANPIFPWAGASYNPGAGPMEPIDLSSKKGVHFWAKGDGRTYQVMLFAKSHGRMPMMHSFTAGASWQSYDMPWSGFEGFDGHDLILVVFSAGMPAGDFDLRLAGVRFE